MNARDLALLGQFVELNREALVKHWNHESDSGDVIQAVRPSRLDQLIAPEMGGSLA